MPTAKPSSSKWGGFCETRPAGSGGRPTFNAHVSCENCGYEDEGPLCVDGYLEALEANDYRQTIDCYVCHGERTLHFRSGDPMKGEPRNLWYCENGCSAAAIRKKLLASGSACGCKGAKCLGDYGKLPERTALYRMYNGVGLLLYVGVAKDFGARWKQHQQDKPWYLDVQKQDVEWFEDREDALAAEEAAIKAERPVYNVMHAPGRVPAAFKPSPAKRCKLPTNAVNLEPCGQPLIKGICGHHGNLASGREDGR